MSRDQITATAPKLRFDAAKQPVLCKMTRQLTKLREIKAVQTVQQHGLNHQFDLVARKTLTLFKDKGESKRLEGALRMATEFAFEKIIANTIRLALTEEHVAKQTASLDVLVLKGAQHVISPVPAPVGENGWMSVKVPVGTSYDSALLLGKHMAWVQIGDVYRVRDETLTKAYIGEFKPGRDMVYDAIAHRGENIYEVGDNGLIYFPAADMHGESGSVIVLLRPLILRQPLKMVQD